MIFSFPVPSISDNELSTESSSSVESTEDSDDSSDHTSSSASESSSESEGEGEQTAQLTGHPATASAGSREKDQGQMKNSYEQCTHSATSWHP